MAYSSFVPDERIEIVRETANSKEECERIKAALESRGFTVIVREPSGPIAEGEGYFATLFAEKRETIMVDTWAIKQEQTRLKKRDRKINIFVILGCGIALVLALLLLLYMLGPLIYAIRGLFKKWI
jgi:hypothetical protein